MALYLVIALLVVIVVLLCVPMKQRPALLRYLVVIVGICGVVVYCGPYLVGLTVTAYSTSVDHFGTKGTLWIGGGIVFVWLMVQFWRMDNKTTSAMRAGDKWAFEHRVKQLQGSPFNYSYEKAVEVASRQRDEKT